MKPSLFKQTEAWQVPTSELRPSPRHWNPGLMFYGGKLWMAYRFHRREAKQRCGVAICPLDPDHRFRPSEPSQFLKFMGPTGVEHHEDCRLFMFRGEPHISYTEMRNYVPGAGMWTCLIKYARLSLNNGRWEVAAEYWPTYGMNSGFAKEKNWVFFERNDKLYCVYSTQPEHIVLEIEREKIVREYRTPGPVWHWGLCRGGASPIWDGDHWLSIFHSSTRTEVGPHYVRYFAGAYTFEPDPPFAITAISEMPLLSGSEEDGHQVDPRYNAGWKPFVVFPCGIVPENDDQWLVSLGVNDWQCAIARIHRRQLTLGKPDGSSFAPRYFTVANGSRPIRFIDPNGKVTFLSWKVFHTGRNSMAGRGFMQAMNARDATEALEHVGAQEITEQQYIEAARSKVIRGTGAVYA